MRVYNYVYVSVCVRACVRACMFFEKFLRQCSFEIPYLYRLRVTY